MIFFRTIFLSFIILSCFHSVQAEVMQEEDLNEAVLSDEGAEDQSKNSVSEEEGSVSAEEVSDNSEDTDSSLGKIVDQIEAEQQEIISNSSLIEIKVPKKQNTFMNFNDFDPSQWFTPYVKDLYDRGIISGFSDGSFQPQSFLNRAELLKMVLSARGETWTSYATVHFLDTKDHWAKDVVEYALEQGYIKPSKKFQPLKPVTRAETMKMLCKLFDIFDESESDTHFTDLEGHWAKNCVMSAYDLGVIKGTSDFKFDPDSQITRSEFSKILAITLEQSAGDEYDGLDLDIDTKTLNIAYLKSGDLEDYTNTSTDTVSDKEYESVYHKKSCDYDIQDAQVYYHGEVMEGVSSSGFVEIDDCYSSNFRKVFYRNKELNAANPDKFDYLDYGFAKDDQLVYYKGSRIRVAHAATFESLGGFYAKDKNYIYYKWYLFDVDPESFEVIYNSYVKVDGDYYHQIFKIEDQSEINYLDSIFASVDVSDNEEEVDIIEEESSEEVIQDDSSDEVALISYPEISEMNDEEMKCVYEVKIKDVYLNSNLVQDIQYQDFEDLSGCYSKNYLHAYYKDNILKLSDKKSLKYLSYGYASDRKYAYFRGELIGISDGSSFESLGGYYAQDRNYIYYKGVRVSGADKDSFTVIDNNYAYDINNYYYFNQVVEDADTLDKLSAIYSNSNSQEAEEDNQDQSNEVESEEESVLNDDAERFMTLNYSLPGGNISVWQKDDLISLNFSEEPDLAKFYQYVDLKKEGKSIAFTGNIQKGEDDNTVMIDLRNILESTYSFKITIKSGLPSYETEAVLDKDYEINFSVL